MTDAELLDFLAWLRKRYLITTMVVEPNPLLPGNRSRLVIESVSNEYLIDLYHDERQHDD